jgi:hypothetical protein
METTGAGVTLTAITAAGEFPQVYMAATDTVPLVPAIAAMEGCEPA